MGGGYYFKFYYHPVIAKPVSVAVINIEVVKEKTLPYIKLMELRERETERLRRESLEQEMKLRAEHERLRKSNASYDQKSEFDKKLAEFEQYFSNKREKATENLNKSLGQVENLIYEVVEDIVKEHGFNLVLNTTAYGRRVVMYNDDSLDITEEVVRRANLKGQSLKIAE